MNNEELKAIAEDASEGKWQQDGFEVISDGIEDRRVARCSWLTDAKFIAAANPAAVLGLIADNERLGLQVGSLEFAKWSCEVNQAAIRAAGHEIIDDLAAERDALKVECDVLRKDAKRYQWLRAQHWSDNKMAVVCHPKSSVKLGFDCPSGDRLDEAIDAAAARGGQSNE